MKKVVFISSVVYFLLFYVQTIAQPVQQLVQVQVSTDRASATYTLNEEVKFTIRVLKNGHPIKEVKLKYQVGPERMKPVIDKEVLLNDEKLEVRGTMREAGFLRCIASVSIDGKIYRGLATAGYSPDAIQPVMQSPEDFDAFWNSSKAELAALPIDAKYIPAPERSTEKTHVFYVNFQNINNSRIYGVLCVPKKPGKYPAILNVPGAGIRPYAPDLEMAERGFVVLSIGVHGIPVNMDLSVYAALETGALKGYFFFNPENRDRFYYKRIYLGCVRSVDFLTTLSEVDTTRIAVTGNSQGGALSIVTAGLDPRIDFLAAVHPALSDLTGYLKGRAGGWPHFFNEVNLPKYDVDAISKSLAYYDVVNFAKRVTVPGYYTWGYNDETCPPTSMHAAYNVIKAPKELNLFLETGHWVFPEQRAALQHWLGKKLSN